MLFLRHADDCDDDVIVGEVVDDDIHRRKLSGKDKKPSVKQKHDKKFSMWRSWAGMVSYKGSVCV